MGRTNVPLVDGEEGSFLNEESTLRMRSWHGSFLCQVFPLKLVPDLDPKHVALSVGLGKTSRKIPVYGVERDYCSVLRLSNTYWFKVLGGVAPELIFEQSHMVTSIKP